MVKSDSINRYNGLIQRSEDECGLGNGGILNNSALYSQFIGWMNEGNRVGAGIVIMSSNGADFDDKGYSTLNTGRLTGTTNRDYNMDASYKLLKFKTVSPAYDGVNPVRAKPIDTVNRDTLSRNAPNADTCFSTDCPKFDERSDGFDLYPKFTTAQVAAGAFIDIEYYRAGREWDTTSGTDGYEPPFDLLFHHFPAVYASWKYCRIHKSDLANELLIELEGGIRNGARIKGLKNDMKDWYSSKQPSSGNITVRRRVRR